MVHADFRNRSAAARTAVSAASLIASLFLLLASCASTGGGEAELSLEDLCNKAATEVSEEIEGKVTSIAILDVQTEYWAVSDYIVDELAHYFTRRLGNGNVIAHDEFTRSLIMNELEYQRTGLVSDETIQEIGRELGVDAVIAGNLSETSSGWNFFVQTTQTESKKVLSSWKGSIRRSDREMKFQIERSQKGSRPPRESTRQGSSGTGAALSASELSVTATMIDESGRSVSVLHPQDVIRFSVSASRNAYLSILCIDAKGEESWLPLNDNYIRAGETRIFPDIPGAVLRVQSGTYGAEQVHVYAATVESELPRQGRLMGTRAFTLASADSAAAEARIDYRVER